MSDRIRMQIAGIVETTSMADQIYKRAADLRPLMRDIGSQLETSTEDNFKGSHDPNGVPWPKSQRVHKSGGKTLVDSAILKNSISSLAGPASVEIGSNIVYARRHNQGFSGTEQVSAHRRVLTTVFGVKLAEPKMVPVKAFSRSANSLKRQFLGVGKHDEADILAIAEAYLGGSE